MSSSIRFNRVTFHKEEAMKTNFLSKSKVPILSIFVLTIHVFSNLNVSAAPVAILDSFHSVVMLRNAAVEAGTVTVTSTGDNGDVFHGDGLCDDGTGACTLRAAIEEANAVPNQTIINFHIAGEGPHSIQPSTPLPDITTPIGINGYTQDGASYGTDTSPATLMIELDGSAAVPDANGLAVFAEDCGIYGLAINRFNQAGILIEGENGINNSIEGNFIGTDINGVIALSNSNGIVLTNGATNNRIGGNHGGARNVISGNSDSGVAIFSLNTNNNLIQGNFIGTNAYGTAAVGNLDGIWLGDGTVGNTIGGTTPAERNIISGNDTFGVSINNAGTAYNRVYGNFIGTDVSGTAAVPNGGGVVFTLGARNNYIGGPFSGAGNTIAFNRGHGIKFHGDAGNGNWIARNSIHSNGYMGIDLIPETNGHESDGVTFNDHLDTDNGPNYLQNFPVIGRFSQADGIIYGYLRSNPGQTYTLEFFSSGMCDELHHGEGERFITSEVVTTDEEIGHTSFSAIVHDPIPFDVFLTATATFAISGSTSEFSRCFPTGYSIERSCGMKITNRPYTPFPGFILTADSTSSSCFPGLPFAEVSLCGVTSVRMTPGDIKWVVCSSASVEVFQGPIEILLEENFEVVVPTGTSVIVEEISEGQITIQKESGTDPVEIVIDGEIIGEIYTGETFDASPHGLKQYAVSYLEDLKSQLNHEGQQKVNQSIAYLNESLYGEPGNQESLWIDSFHLEPEDGDDVFGKENDAVEMLMEILNEPDEYGATEESVSEIVTIIKGQILEADRMLAQKAIEEASSGDAKLLKKATKEMIEAESEINDGHYINAMEHYSQAWEAALKSIGAL